MADWDDHDSGVAELLDERRRRLWPPGCDDDAVKGRLLRPAQGAVVQLQPDAKTAHVHESLLGRQVKLADALDAVDFHAHGREDRRLIARARADFQDPQIRRRLQQLGHQRDNVWLRNGLAQPDRQGVVLVGLGSKRLLHEEVPGHDAHGLEHRSIRDAPGLDLFRNHPLAVSFEVVSHPVFVSLLLALKKSIRQGLRSPGPSPARKEERMQTRFEAASQHRNGGALLAPASRAPCLGLDNQLGLRERIPLAN